jgi:hypothetical protein
MRRGIVAEMRTKQKQATAESNPVASKTPPTSVMSWFTQTTLVLALITFFGYYGALLSEAGFCAYFGIPFHFIPLSLTLVLANSMIWLLIVPPVCVFILVVMGMGALIGAYNNIGGCLLILEAIGIGIINPVLRERIWLWLTNPVLREIKTLTYVGITVLVIVLLVWLYKRDVKLVRRVFGWLFKRSEKKDGDKNELLTLVNAAGVAFGVIIFCTVIFYGHFGLQKLGRTEAQEQVRFSVIESGSITNMVVPEVAVIRNYGEYLFTVPIIRKTDEHNKPKVHFEKKVYILKMSELKKPLFAENIGPLQEKPSEPSQSN